MKAETLQEAKDLEGKISNLKNHLIRIESYGVKDIRFIDKGGDTVAPKTDLLPISLADFVQLYVSKVQAQINKLQAEFDKL